MNVQRISCASSENFRKKSKIGRVNPGFTAKEALALSALNI